MKVTLNSNYQTTNLVWTSKRKNMNYKSCVGEGVNSYHPSIPANNYCMVNFKAKPDSCFLLSQADNLLCAYSRKPMLSPYAIRAIFARLAKKTNAQAAVNLLKEYEGYMQGVETEIFDLFNNYENKGKKDFQGILLEQKREALERLRRKQANVIDDTDEFLTDLSPNARNYVSQIRENAMTSIYDPSGSFNRHDILQQLKSIDSSKENLITLDKLYRQWYKLPRSYKDYDAFIVKYSAYTHEEIAQRLLNTSMATIEHIIPSARGGQDELGNYLLVSELYNNDRDIMPLSEYIELNPDIEIKTNLQKYADDIVNKINSGNSPLVKRIEYPSLLRESIFDETKGELKLNIGDIKILSNKLQGSQKGANRYRQNRR